MRTNSILTRTSDGKKFIVTDLAHWSQIQSLDKTETDTVKWYGGNGDVELYVGSTSGFGYELRPNDQ